LVTGLPCDGRLLRLAVDDEAMDAITQMAKMPRRMTTEGHRGIAERRHTYQSAS
jgi:hypothetical protein